MFKKKPDNVINLNYKSFWCWHSHRILKAWSKICTPRYPKPKSGLTVSLKTVGKREKWFWRFVAAFFIFNLCLLPRFENPILFRWQLRVGSNFGALGFCIMKIIFGIPWNNDVSISKQRVNDMKGASCSCSLFTTHQKYNIIELKVVVTCSYINK